MTVIKLGCKIMGCYKNVKNWDAIIMPSCCRFSSIVWVSISDPEPRFINMVLFSAMLNRLTYLFSKTATTFDLRDSDFRICKGCMHLYSWFWSLMLHNCSKEFKFWAWSALPMHRIIQCRPRFGIIIQRLFFLLINSYLEVLSCLRLNREDDLVTTV